MIVGDITELSVVSVLDRGVPNQECIAIRAYDHVNLGQYGIMLGAYAQYKAGVPYFDHLFWFGDGFVKPGDWLFVYTGSGQARKGRNADDTADIHSLYWGKPTTVFADSFVVPMLFRADAVDVMTPPDNVPQLDQS